MAKQVRSNARRPARRRPPQKRRRRRFSFPAAPEFRQDELGGGFFKTLRFTRLQRLQLTKWLLYIAICTLCLVIQDSVMSRISLLDSTSDLAAGILLLITMMEGSEIGSVFILISSLLYYFSGSAPGAYTVGLLTTLGICITVLRQQLWHRSMASILLSTGLALLAYELGLYGIGLFLGLTRWTRIFSFILTAIYTTGAMVPFYYLIYVVGQIGGSTWKE